MKSKIILLALLFCLTGCSRESGVQESQAPNESQASAESQAPSESAPTLADLNTAPNADLNRNATMPAQLTETDMTEEQAAAAAKATASAAQEFYDYNYDMIELLSRFGFMYSCPGDEYLDVATLVEIGDLEESYKDLECAILYVRPADMSAVAGIGATEQNPGELAIYAVCVTKNGATVASAEGNVYHCAKDKIEKLIEHYSKDNGPVFRYNSESGVYKSIVEASAAEEQMQADEIDTRYLAADEKYGYILFTPKSKPTLFKSYFFEKQNDKWAVLVSNFHDEYQSRAMINAVIPTVNFNIFPEYDPYYILKYIGSSFDGVISSMEPQLQLKADEKLAFVSGTAECIYFTYNSGRRLLATSNENDEWNVNPVGTYLIAEALMIEKIKDPPVFIVKQE